jgi:hypothetical protein
MRQCIERAFGILTRRWDIFWHALYVNFYRWTFVATVCAKLHNLCIDFKVNNEIIQVAEKDYDEGDSADVFLNNCQDNDYNVAVTNDDKSSVRRLHIAGFLIDAGYLRPHHANSDDKS